MDTTLNNAWTLYFHDPNNSNWDLDSYIVLQKFNNVTSWIKIFHALRNDWSKGMFFLMREDIKPLWELNESGGCDSFKLFKTEVKDIWFELTSKLLGETLLSHAPNKLSGISISPKKNYCIIRIWLTENRNVTINNYDIKLPTYTKVIYRSHLDNKDYKDINETNETNETN